MPPCADSGSSASDDSITIEASGNRISFGMTLTINPFRVAMVPSFKSGLKRSGNVPGSRSATETCQSTPGLNVCNEIESVKPRRKKRRLSTMGSGLDACDRDKVPWAAWPSLTVGDEPFLFAGFYCTPEVSPDPCDGLITRQVK